jgi:anti-sigma factor RsiW
MTRSGIRADAVPRPLIECERTVRRLWDYLDGRLPAMAREEVEAHLAVCAGCPSHLAFAERMRRSVAAAGPAPMSGADEADLRERVRRALERIARSNEPSGNERSDGELPGDPPSRS